MTKNGSVFCSLKRLNVSFNLSLYSSPPHSFFFPVTDIPPSINFLFGSSTEPVHVCLSLMWSFSILAVDLGMKYGNQMIMRLQLPVPFNGLISVSPLSVPPLQYMWDHWAMGVRAERLPDGAWHHPGCQQRELWVRKQTQEHINTCTIRYWHAHSYKHISFVVFSSCLSAGGQRTTVSSTACL